MFILITACPKNCEKCDKDGKCDRFKCADGYGRDINGNCLGKYSGNNYLEVQCRLVELHPMVKYSYSTVITSTHKSSCQITENSMIF